MKIHYSLGENIIKMITKKTVRSVSIKKFFVERRIRNLIQIKVLIFNWLGNSFGFLSYYNHFLQALKSKRLYI
jgi:hypothetical protein